MLGLVGLLRDASRRVSPRLPTVKILKPRLRGGLDEALGMWRVGIDHGHRAVEAATAVNRRSLAARYSSKLA